MLLLIVKMFSRVFTFRFPKIAPPRFPSFSNTGTPPRDAGDKSPHSNARPAVSAPVLTWDKGKKLIHVSILSSKAENLLNEGFDLN